ncbi:MAG: 3-deoxy-7-phosphoheptulonate synthase [Candidatus Ancillula sp.]|jgi:3-deoxy-7-phosphoheptulonate synthase|nr:3-deoxy-7-phosphoheptulonate synthase [Candidatus Ancillula sp.]
MMCEKTFDVRIRKLHPMITPREVIDKLPLDEKRAKFVRENRADVEKTLNGHDNRLLCVVGPCSIHDPKAAAEYAQMLAEKAKEHSETLLILMRTYFEKPRTTIGWKGLINDPDINGTYNLAKGVVASRGVIFDVLDTGIGVATEFLDPISPQYISDAVSWGAIGARTTESPIHRQLASGLSMPIGFKNTTEGSIQAAIDATVAAKITHTFFSVNFDGRLISAETDGNLATHIILRGDKNGPNYDKRFVDEALTLARLNDAPSTAQFGVIIDAAHGNSKKNEVREAQVVRELAERIRSGEKGISGIMMESFIEGGTQPAAPLACLKYGQSITDPCIDWGTTSELLDELSDGVKVGRMS